MDIEFDPVIDTLLTVYESLSELGSEPTVCEICAAAGVPELDQGTEERLFEAIAAIEEFDDTFGSVGDEQRFAAGLGQFSDLTPIGQGGMGVVYRAKQRSLDRWVAIKTVRWESSIHLTQFRTEARRVAGLAHPNIVNVHDFVESDGEYFLVMEYVDGGTLRDALQRCTGSREVDDAVASVRTLADTVAFVHRQGVLHLDLKPSNVLVDNGVPKIADFGLAVIAAEGMASRGRGTRNYMAPEQLGKRGTTMDGRTDVYALGCVLYELLTGQAPLPNPTDEEIREHLPVPAADANPCVPQDLSAVCMKCLDKSPDRRYQSANELGDDLKHYLSGDPMLAAHQSYLANKRRKWRRDPRRFVQDMLRLTVAVALVLLGIGYVGWTHTSARLALARTEKRRAETATEIQSGRTMLAVAARANDKDRVLATIKHFKSLLAANPPVDQQAEIHFQIGEANRTMARNRREGDRPTRNAVEQYEAALALQPSHSMALQNMATLYEESGQYKNAIEANRRLLRLFPDSAPARNNLANALISMANSEPNVAAQFHAEAVVHYKAAIEMDARYPDPHYNLGNYYAAVGQQLEDDQQRAQHFHRAIDCYSSSLKINPRIKSAYINRGNMHRRLTGTLGRNPNPERVHDLLTAAYADYKRAVRCHREASSLAGVLYLIALAEDDPLTAMEYCGVASLLLTDGGEDHYELAQIVGVVSLNLAERAGMDDATFWNRLMTRAENLVVRELNKCHELGVADLSHRVANDVRFKALMKRDALPTLIRSWE